ncbi:SIS domain-containing protein [Salinarimonas soli]|uniref:SIS domain-containing protein n=1 Tax=Salinarimonas soli TaxID=1638099 RepID=A0A5B2W0P4_9HYPH|nr:SIS domain-containing protein [Salinarimonas soli]KAA2244290.1 SIS domain-containing protein [Salinarimonas soli]
MLREVREIPAALTAALAGRAGRFAELAERYRAAPPRLLVFCGRGSSGHAGMLLRYLAETRLGIPVSASAPSVVTSFDRVARLDGAWFVVISQSGGSPDLVAATRAARAGGALTIAILNDTASPVAGEAEIVLPMGAGAEVSVAATKSVATSMAISAGLVAAIARDEALDASLDRLPERARAALALDWPALVDDLQGARCAFVTARGFGLGSARELALKMAETLRLPALAYSAAELLHGPRAAIARDTPVLALRVEDATAPAVDTLVEALRSAGVPVHLCGGAAGSLSWIGDDHPVTDAIAMLVPAYRAIEAGARRLGFDPDRPPYLSKVTRTL